MGEGGERREGEGREGDHSNVCTEAERERGTLEELGSDGGPSQQVTGPGSSRK